MKKDIEYKKVKILLVEDNPGDIRLTKEVFKDSKHDISIDVCYDGEEAIQYFNQKLDSEEFTLPDIIILDLNLPRKNGLELLKDIKSNDSICHVPVIVLTSSEADGDIKSVYEEKANCYLTKPVDYDEFCKAINLIERFWFSTASLPSFKK